MATTNEPTTILLVSKNPSIIESTHTVLANEANLILNEEEVTSKTLFNVITESQPNVILFDFEFHGKPFSLVDKIASKNPMSAVVAILSESQAINLDRVVLSGARAFIFYPFQPGKLVITIRRINELLERNQPRSPKATSEKPAEKPRKIITVFSPKGGVGTTTIATNLAISLFKNIKQDVLLIDGKHLFGHVALYLNLRTGNSITDLIAHAGMLDSQLIKQVVERHKSGIHVLPSPKSISEAQGIRPENLFNVLQGLQQVFPNII
ncbi:MAG: AAA family ATPase, partial [Chloroflexota bacterium]|nr:AAA family ATPase [Chloroflexota bacterium]